MKYVTKKILPVYFDAVESGAKPFELRKDEDDIQIGDVLELDEWDNKRYTGQKLIFNVTYVLRNCPEYGLMNGYCIIGLERRSPC